MKKLKIILLFNILISIFISYLFQSKYNVPSSNKLNGVVLDYNIDGDKLTLDVKSNKRVIANYYFKSEMEKTNFNLEIGNKVNLNGVYKEVNNNTNFNLFNYKKYLLSKKIYYTFDISDITIIKSTNFMFKVKNNIISRINKSKNKTYLRLFILGDNNLDSEIKESYKINGVSHLFAISGMHITLFTSFFLFILKLINKKETFNFIIICLFLIIYINLVNFIPSVVRASLFFIVLNIKKFFKINLSNFELLICLLLCLLIYNPFYIYNMGFLYSFIISISLIYFSGELKNGGYIKTLFKTSLISFLIGIPLTINNSFEINLLTPFLNVIFVPFVSFIIFPLSLINFIFPFIDPFNSLFINILEFISINLSKYGFILITCKMPNYIFILYYTFIIYIIKHLKIINIIILIIVLLIHSNIKYLNNNPVVTIIDVGQGDSILIELPHNKNVLIDTGGIVIYKKEEWMVRRKNYSIAKDKIVPMLKSFGIKELDFQILSHGDFDHMGEAINLVNNFKVEKVIFNCGPYNALEKELIKLLDKKHIKYYSCIKELNIDNNKLYFLQTKEYDNENDNSNVIYTELNGYKFMFMGDASVTTEHEIIDKYNLSDIDVLKVGHHGSKTSSGKEFINAINPRYSVISVGKKNRYGHPNKEALENLKESKKYRTDIDGSIMFEIKNNKLKIETCSP